MKLHNKYPKLIDYLKKYYPYLIFFGLILFIHLFMDFTGDDIIFSKYLTKQSLIEFIRYKYYNWSSRLIIESILVYLTRYNMHIWLILDTLLYTVGVYYIIKLVNRNNNKNITIFGILLFLMYPFYELGSAGWITTTLNYSWCFAFGIISFIPLIKKSYNEKTNFSIYLISLFGLLYATNQEQTCALIFGFNLLYLINSIMKKERINNYNLLSLILASISLIIILTCPGNNLRFNMALINTYPEFANYGIIQKIYLGTVPTVARLLRDKILFTLFYIILNITTLIKFKNMKLKYISYFNIIFILTIILTKTVIDISEMQSYTYIINYTINGYFNYDIVPPIIKLESNLPIISNSLHIFTYKKIPNLGNSSTLITITISIYLIISSILMLYANYGKKKLFPIILFIAGFLSSFIMGFSPTVFDSEARTCVFFHILLIPIILMLINKLYEECRIDYKLEKLMKIIFIIFVGFIYINTIFIIEIIM